MLITISEFSLLHSVYTTILGEELGHPVPLPSDAQATLSEGQAGAAGRPIPETLRHWIGLLDYAISPQLLRNFVTEKELDDATFRALIRFLAGKRSHSYADRDKLDWLSTYLFRRREDRTKSSLGWFKPQVLELLEGFEFPALSRYAEELLSEIPSLLDEVKELRSFGQITDSRLIERGRDLKNQFRDEFFHPDVVAAVVNYNLLSGKKFHDLFQETLHKMRAIAEAQREDGPPEPEKLLQRDYRSTGEAFRQWSELERKEAVAAPAASAVVMPAAPEAAEAAVVEHLRHLGINLSREAESLRTHEQELALRLRANPRLTVIPSSVAPLALQEWESTAFRIQYPESEQTFRADFARSICHAIALTWCIYEETPQYLEKKSTEFHWKKHYETLVYLRYHGHVHKLKMMQLITDSQQRGLLEKAKQLQATAEKLQAGLDKAADLF